MDYLNTEHFSFIGKWAVASSALQFNTIGSTPWRTTAAAAVFQQAKGPAVKQTAYRTLAVFGTPKRFRKVMAKLSRPNSKSGRGHTNNISNNLEINSGLCMSSTGNDRTNH